MTITHNELKTVLSYNADTGCFRWLVRKNGQRAVVGHVNAEGYLDICIKQRTYRAHRLAWFYAYGEWPPHGMYIDHVNGDRADNRLSNLRLATHAQNLQNCKVKRNSSSGLKGVYWHKRRKKWRSRIRVNGHVLVLGFFSTKEEAHKAYCDAARLHHGQFMRT